MCEFRPTDKLYLDGLPILSISLEVRYKLSETTTREMYTQTNDVL